MAAPKLTEQPGRGRRPATTADPPSVADVELRGLCQQVAAGSISLVTSDVFDTIVFRPVRTPIAVFDLIGEALIERGMLRPHITAQAFGRLRETAERKARVVRHAAYADHEASLDEIYRQAELLLVDGATPEEAAAVEVAIERDVIVPNLDVVATLCWIADRDVPVIAVSDSYFSSGQIRELFAQPILEHLELADVVTSSDRRRNKGGGLLEELIAEIGVPTARLAHIGDHPEADLIVARRVGARPVYLNRQPLEMQAITESEKRFSERRVTGFPERYDAGVGSIRAQLLRSFELDSLSPALASYWAWGATVLGPVLTGFAGWINARLDELESKRVWCLMREGTLLAQLIAASAERDGRELDVRTLWLNRAVCGRAALTEITPASLRRVAGTQRTPTLTELLQSIGLRVGDLPQLASHADTSVDDPVVHALLIDALTADEPLRARALADAARIRERVCALVRRELDGGEDRLCVVDLGWGGSVPALLEDICAAEALEIELRGLYLATNEAAAERVLGGVLLEGFLGELNLPEPLLAWFGRSPELIEQACMSEEGPQVDIDAELEPVLGAQHVPAAQRAQIRAVQDGVVAFQRLWNRYQQAAPGKLGALHDQQALLRAILVRAVVSPTAREAAALGSWLHDTGEGESSRLDELIGDDGMARLSYVAPDELDTLPATRFYWPYALAALAGPPTAELLALVHEGRLPRDALSQVVPTGPFRIGARGGAGCDGPTANCVVEPRRNRDGLTLIRGLVIANHIVTLELQPATAPVLARIDWLELRLWAQGVSAPIVVRMEQTDELRRLVFANCTLLAPNLVIGYTGDAAWRLDLAAVTERIVYRAEVECALAMLPIAPLVSTKDVLLTLDDLDEIERARAALASVVDSFSWRITRPLRAIKHLLRG
jgi:FMN phosphatase YigB (HAD superfamily)